MNLSETFRLALGGIGSGKSAVGAVMVASDAFNDPGSVSMVVAPTYNMLQAATLPALMEWIPKEAIVSFNRAEWRMELFNGSVIWFRNASQPDNLRGPNVKKMWIDEGALIKKEAWQILIGRARLPGANVTVTTTPKGKNWLWETFVRDRTADHALVRMPTKENRKHLRPGFIESLGYTGKFAEQELNGAFVNFEGLVYDQFDRERHVFSAKQAQDWLQQGKFVGFVAGVDWGYSHAGAMLVDGVDYDGRTYQIEEHYQRRLFVAPTDVGQDSWLQRAVDIALRYPGIRFYCDPSGAANVEMLADAVLQATGRCDADGNQNSVFKAANAVDTGISEVSSRLALRGDGTYGAYYSEACPNTIAEFESYHYKEGTNGNAGRAIVKEGDDAMDADRYKKMGLRTGVQQVIERYVYTPDQIIEQWGGYYQ